MTAIMPDTTAELRVRTGYFDAAFDDTGGIIERARITLADVDFDTFVATGLSGTCIATVLAHALGKKVLIVRKDDDTSNHSGKRYAGNLGRRWIFVDDFVSSGATRRRVIERVRRLVEFQHDHGYYEPAVGYVIPKGFATEMVGEYMYTHGGSFTPASAIED